MDIGDLTKRFVYYPANTDERANRHQAVRRVMQQAAIGVESYCPDGREKSLAITKLEEAMFWANAAIARENVENKGD